MSDYTNTFGGAAKDGINATVLGADHDTQLDAIATMSATKADKLNFTSTGIDDNAASTVLTIDSGGSSTFSGSVTASSFLGNATTATTATSATSATTATTAGTVTAAAQAAITSVGTLTSLSVTGAITSGAVNSNVKLNTKVIDIGDWNMDSTQQVSIAHGLTKSKIRSISVFIRADVDTNVYSFPASDDGPTALSYANTTNIVLQRALSGTFDSTTFDDTSYNRGWITIQYID